LVELKGVSKTYRENGVRALSEVDFSLKRGEIHAIVGENGAGKSTLMHILGGFARPDSGKILLNGKPLHFPAPAAALRAGIGMVRQRPSLVEHFSVWENCALGAAITRKTTGTVTDSGGFFFSRKKAHDAAGALAAKLDFHLSLDAKAGTLSLADQKKTAVLSLVMHGAAFFIFDEPFACLRRDEKDEMRRLFFSLRDEGKGVAVIAHEIREMLPVSDRVTVLRKGRVMLAGEPGGWGEARVIEAMFGKIVDAPEKKAQPEQQAFADSTVAALSVKNLSVDRPPFYPLKDISLEIRRGEIVGIAGVRESGIETLELVLAGLLKPTSGVIETPTVGVFQTETGSPQHNTWQERPRFAYIGMGGTAEAFAPTLSVRDNLILHEHRIYTNKYGVLDGKALSGFAESLVHKAGLSVPLAAPFSSLSGGMQTRIIAEREMAAGADVLLLSDPTSGLDLQALGALLAKVRMFANKGGAVLLFFGGTSVPEHGTDGITENHELGEVCDRVFFINGGRILSPKTAQTTAKERHDV
jgi:simple sugar transport system ATP-binding protein